MNLVYNGFNLHDLGEFAVSRTTEYEGGDAPQRAKVTLKVTVWLFEQDYESNYALIRAAREALRTQQGMLRWTNTDANLDYLNQTVTLVSSDLPEEWGQFFQQLNVVFSYYEHDLITQNLPLFFKRTGSNDSITFTNVAKFAEEASTERFSTLRAHRKETRGKLTVSGQILADPTQPLADRRDALKAVVERYREQMNGADGTVQFGLSGNFIFDRLVRIESFSLELDEMIVALNFSFTAGYTLFPDETGYATVEYSVEQRDDMSGQEMLSFSGKVQAQTEAAARSKLTSLTSTVLAQYGYDTMAQQLRFDTSANSVSANADGVTFIELTFTAEYRRWRATNQQATFKKTGGTIAIPFGNVHLWDVRYTARRFNDQRSQRQHAGGVIEASGTWNFPGNTADSTTTTPAARRAALLTQQRAMLAEVNHADGTLVYGDYSQVVRIEDLKADVNQSEKGIDWSFTATFSLFPNEAGYATCDFTVAQRDQVEDGDELLTFTGRIGAQNGAAARSKLASLRTSILAIYGYTDAQRIRGESSVAGIDANGDKTAGIAEGLETATEDGVSFIELSFNEEYRRRKADQISSSLQINVRDDATTGLVLTTYSGFVTASGATVDAAYAAAQAKAVALGSGKESALTDPSGNAATLGFLKSSQITWDQRQSKQVLSVTDGSQDSAIEFVRLTFTYDYQAKMPAGRAYIEVNTSIAKDGFGLDTESVSGFVVARDFATADLFYQLQVRSLYNGLLIRSESTTQNKTLAEKLVNAQSTFTAEQVRLEFQFQVQRTKTNYGMNYSITVTRDFLTCEMATHLRGSIYGPTYAAASNVLDSFLTLELDFGVAPLRDERTQDMNWKSDGPSDAQDSTPPGLFVKLDFDLSYSERLTGVNGLLEFRLTEEIQYSGTRWTVQPLPFAGTPPANFNPADPGALGGVSVVQPTGLEAGSRTVRGSVTGATRAVCTTWAKDKRTMLTGDLDSVKYPQPEKWDWDFEIVPRTQGLITGTNPDVKIHRLNFTFAEILPHYPPPT